MSFEYDECGNVCGETNELCQSFCEDCPVKINEDNFKDLTISELDARLPVKWKKWSFNSLLQTVSDVAELTESKREIRSVKTQKLIDAWESVKNRLKRIDEQNSRKSDE